MDLDRPADLTWWERVLWAMRDELTNQYWAEARAHRLAREAFTR